MKFLEKVGLVLFSNIVLILSVVFVFILFNFINIAILEIIIDSIKASNTIFYGMLIGTIICIALSIRCIFFTDLDGQDSKKDGVIVETQNGKILITKETIENIVSSVIKGFEGAREATTKIGIDEENNVNVFVTLNVLPNVVIKDLIGNIQDAVKVAIKKASDLEVKQVYVKVKSIYENKLES